MVEVGRDWEVPSLHTAGRGERGCGDCGVRDGGRCRAEIFPDSEADQHHLLLTVLHSQFAAEKEREEKEEETGGAPGSIKTFI